MLKGKGVRRVVGHATSEQARKLNEMLGVQLGLSMKSGMALTARQFSTGWTYDGMHFDVSMATKFS